MSDWIWPALAVFFFVSAVVANFRRRRAMRRGRR